jgi:hypothetical protein
LFFIFGIELEIGRSVFIRIRDEYVFPFTDGGIGKVEYYTDGSNPALEGESYGRYPFVTWEKTRDYQELDPERSRVFFFVSLRVLEQENAGGSRIVSLSCIFYRNQARLKNMR